MTVCTLVFSDRLSTLSTPVYLLLKMRGFAQKRNPRNGQFNQTQCYMQWARSNNVIFLGKKF